jgi:hypothetical protein
MIKSITILNKIANRFEKNISKLNDNPITITKINLEYHPHNTPFKSGVNYSLQGSIAGNIKGSDFIFNNLHKNIDSNRNLDSLKFSDYQKKIKEGEKEITPIELARHLAPKLLKQARLLGLVDDLREFERDIFVALTTASGLEQINLLIDQITKHCYNARLQNYLSNKGDFDLEEWFALRLT